MKFQKNVALIYLKKINLKAATFKFVAAITLTLVNIKAS